MNVDELSVACEALRSREGTNARHIGCQELGNNSPNDIPNLADWANSNALTGVIWAALPPKFAKIEALPSSDQIIHHLDSLCGEKRIRAEEYIRKTPKQIRTKFRDIIEKKLGWFPEQFFGYFQRIRTAAQQPSKNLSQN